MNIKAAMTLFFSLSSLCHAMAHAQVYHVRQNATGANNGSDWSNAFTSLPQTQVRGATYYIADGEYPRLTIESAEVGLQRITVKKATAEEHGSAIGWLSNMGDGYARFAGSTLKHLWFLLIFLSRS